MKLEPSEESHGHRGVYHENVDPKPVTSFLRNKYVPGLRANLR